jgi:hypothetical protein
MIKTKTDLLIRDNITYNFQSVGTFTMKDAHIHADHTLGLEIPMCMKHSLYFDVFLSLSLSLSIYIYIYIYIY